IANPGFLEWLNSYKALGNTNIKRSNDYISFQILLWGVSFLFMGIVWLCIWKSTKIGSFFLLSVCLGFCIWTIRRKFIGNKTNKNSSK
ncbi:MAG: hypothetical protein WCL00_10450, partial [Bacteroidota bacterium]